MTEHSHEKVMNTTKLNRIAACSHIVRSVRIELFSFPWALFKLNPSLPNNPHKIILLFPSTKKGALTKHHRLPIITTQASGMCMDIGCTQKLWFFLYDFYIVVLFFRNHQQYRSVIRWPCLLRIFIKENLIWLEPGVIFIRNLFPEILLFRLLLLQV